MPKFFTSESVTVGHPDKLCDFIADSILDELLSSDPLSRVACEVTASGKKLNIFGEITSNAKVDYEKIARRAIKEAGYTKDEYIFNDRCSVDVNIQQQSNDINHAVTHSDGELGAGDQGLMFGFACNETPSFMPFAVDAAHMLTKKLRRLREDKTIPYLRPDGKSQVSVEYDDSGAVNGISAVVLSAQTDDGIDINTIRDDIEKKLIRANIDAALLKKTVFFINPSGRFVLGGPAGDSGLTGRKIIVDTYGGAAHHGGGSFSGKDPTKVDRSVTYMLRRIAKNIVFHHLADRVEIQAAYSIGIAEPVSLMVNTFGTSKISESKILEKIRSFYKLSPKSIIDFLDLQKPVYARTNDGGAFGNSSFKASWEDIDADF